MCEVSAAQKALFFHTCFRLRKHWWIKQQETNQSERADLSGMSDWIAACDKCGPGRRWVFIRTTGSAYRPARCRITHWPIHIKPPPRAVQQHHTTAAPNPCGHRKVRKFTLGQNLTNKLMLFSRLNLCGRLCSTDVLLAKYTSRLNSSICFVISLLRNNILELKLIWSHYWIYWGSSVFYSCSFYFDVPFPKSIFSILK